MDLKSVLTRLEFRPVFKVASSRRLAHDLIETRAHLPTRTRHSALQLSTRGRAPYCQVHEWGYPRVKMAHREDAEEDTVAEALADYKFEGKLYSISQALEDASNNSGHAACVYCVAFSPDGQLLLTGSADKTAKLWSYHTRVSPPPLPVSTRLAPAPPHCAWALTSAPHLLLQHVLYTFKGHEQWVQGVAFGNTKMTICTGCDDKYVRVWEHSSEAHSLAEGWTMTAELGRLHDDVHAHTLSALSVAFDPTDEFAVSGGADTAVKLWRLNDKELAHDMLGHLDWVTKVVRATISTHIRGTRASAHSGPCACSRPKPPRQLS